MAATSVRGLDNFTEKKLILAEIDRLSSTCKSECRHSPHPCYGISTNSRGIILFCSSRLRIRNQKSRCPFINSPICVSRNVSMALFPMEIWISLKNNVWPIVSIDFWIPTFKSFKLYRVPLTLTDGRCASSIYMYLPCIFAVNYKWGDWRSRSYIRIWVGNLWCISQFLFEIVEPVAPP